MTAQSKSTIKSFFETGDYPTQSNFEDLVDSYLGLAETSTQTIQGSIVVSGAVSVSGAANFYGNITMNANAASAARSAMSLGTAALVNVGVSANNVPQLDSQNRLPAVNGSLLTGITTGALILIQTQSANNTSSIDFTSGINATYNEYLLTFTGVRAQTTGFELYLRVSEDGATFKSGVSDYKYCEQLISQGGAYSQLETSAAAQIQITNGTAITSAASTNGFVLFSNPSGTTENKEFRFDAASQSVSTNVMRTWHGSGYYIGTTNAITGVRLLIAGENINRGVFKLYGRT